MRALLIALSCLLFTATGLSAERVVAALSQERVSIDTNFDGSEITIYGAVVHETAIDPSAAYDLIVTVSGPLEQEVVLRKDRLFGLWVNVETQQLGFSPTFYSVVSSREITSDLLSPKTDAKHQITTEEMVLPDHRGTPFREALIRLRRDQELYRERSGDIELVADTLFSTSVALPANLTKGDYLTRIFLLREGDVIDKFETSISVRKVGLGRWLTRMAVQRPAYYGLIAICLAIFFGWAASEVFRIARRR